MISRNRLYSFITFVITATMVNSSPQTLYVQEYSGPNGILNAPSIQLYQGFKPGMVLGIVGSSTTNTLNYHVFDVSGNTLLIVQPRPHKNAIGLNHYIGGWGADVQTSKLSFKGDDTYYLHIAYETHGYRLFYNGEAVYFFKHRSQNKATEFGVSVTGGGKIFLMSYTLNEPKWAIRESMNGVFTKDFGDDGIDTPYKIQFQGRNQLSTIAITGIISANATCVEFNLMNSDGEILFQFNPRFTDNVVAHNSYIDGRWGREETSDAMVLQRNQRFTLAIDVEADYYKIYVNGQDYFTYEYRRPAHNTKITKLFISEDIKLFKIIYHK